MAEMTSIYSNDGFRILEAQNMVFLWFSTSIFCILRSMHLNQVLALLKIAWLTEAAWDTSGVGLFPF